LSFWSSVGSSIDGLWFFDVQLLVAFEILIFVSCELLANFTSWYKLILIRTYNACGFFGFKLRAYIVLIVAFFYL
jgi:hypothetical protein